MLGGANLAIYESAEDYLERILMLQKKGMNVRSIDIAQSFNYSRASISRAINNLKNDHLIDINASGVITLTKEGYEIALKIYNRHVILTDFFVKIGVPKEIATNDACKIEHDLSEETFNAIINHIKK